MGSVCFNYCPGKEAALVSIVVSLTCTAYQCGALIALCEIATSFEPRAASGKACDRIGYWCANHVLMHRCYRRCFSPQFIFHIRICDVP